MIEITGSLDSFIHNSRRFFRNAQYFHIVLAVCMFGTGVAGIALSIGSDGSAQVPYFFSAFIAGTWHIVFIVMCQVCMYYLCEDRANKANVLVRAYSVVCSVFVLFNVMGVVFTVVNGICIENMMCYYDKNHMSNRSMAILLILEHCVSILGSILFAKRSHVIDAGLSADIAIKLNQHFDFLRIRTRKRSTVSRRQSESSGSQQTTPSHSDKPNESALSEIHSKGGHVLTTIEISAMTRKKTHRRSKSQPNMVKELGLKPPEIEGQVFSIYSDSETKDRGEARKKKRRFIPSKSNRVTATIEINTGRQVRSKSTKNEIDNSFSEDDSLSSYGTPRMTVEERKQQLNQLEKLRKTTAPLASEDSGEADVFHMKPRPNEEQLHKHEELLKRQARLQKEQEKLLEEQRKLFQVQQQQQLERPAPPPYESWEGPEKAEPEITGTILQVEAAENSECPDAPL